MTQKKATTKKTSTGTKAETKKTVSKAKVENSPKIAPKKTTTKKAEAPKTVKSTAKGETAKKPTTAKKTAKKVEKPAVKTEPNKVNAEARPMATIFPQEFEHTDFGKVKACPDKYHTIDEIRKALEDGVELVFACYWTKQFIKQFNYGANADVKAPKEFPYDLDTCQPIYVCDSNPIIYTLSTYTEAMFKFFDTDLVPIECKTNDGEVFMMRYSQGLEFEIYEVVAE